MSKRKSTDVITLNAMEKRRLNSLKNVEILKSMGLYVENNENKTNTTRKYTKKKIAENSDKRRSKRIENLKNHVSEDIEVNETDNLNFKSEIKTNKENKLKDISETNMNALKNISSFLKFIPSDKLNENTDIKRYTDSLRKMKLYKYLKIFNGCIKSMSFHPSESKLFIAAGDVFGNISLSHLNQESKTEETFETFRPHLDAVYSVSFSKNNPVNLYSTSVDGSTKRTDFVKIISEEIYSTDYTHTTWHIEKDENTLLISHGSGDVLVLDLRTRKIPQAYYRCHKKSARTIDINPMNKNYFVTSSKTKEVRIWDLRKIKSHNLGEGEPLESVHSLLYSSSVTSAFYSPNGLSLLTTCFDNRVRIYQELETKPQVVLEYNHKMLLSAYHSTFKANWHPERNDIFFIPTQNKPRSIQLLSVHGKLINELSDPEINTICSTCCHHPKMNVIAGGDNQGRLYIFAEND